MPAPASRPRSGLGRLLPPCYPTLPEKARGCFNMARWSSALLSILLLTALLVGRPALAQAPAEPTPDQVKSLLQLLSDPVVKGWIERESKGEAAAPPSAGSELTQEEASVSGFVEGRLVA